MRLGVAGPSPSPAQVFDMMPESVVDTSGKAFFSGTGILLTSVTRGGLGGGDAARMSELLASSVGFGLAWFSPPVGSIRFALGADVLLNLAIGRELDSELPTWVGARGWAAFDYDVDEGLFVALDLFAEPLRRHGDKFHQAEGAGISLALVPTGFVVNTVDDVAVRIAPHVGMLFPIGMEDAGWSWFAGLELSVAFQRQSLGH